MNKNPSSKIAGFDAVSRGGIRDSEGEPGDPRIVPALPHIPTGKRAEQSLGARVTRNAKKPYGEDTQWPVQARAAKRQARRLRGAESRKHQRGYVRRQLAMEREASQLAQLFNIIDGLVSSTPNGRTRARQAIEARVVFLQSKNPELADDEAIQQLRGVAKTARTVIPKSARRRQALDDFFARELVG